MFPTPRARAFLKNKHFSLFHEFLFERASLAWLPAIHPQRNMPMYLIDWIVAAVAPSPALSATGRRTSLRSTKKLTGVTFHLNSCISSRTHHENDCGCDAPDSVCLAYKNLDFHSLI